MPPGYICDCTKVGKKLQTIKNSDGLYVCARCGLVLPEDFDPEKETDPKDLELGSQMDFSRINEDPDADGLGSYTERLQKIKDRIDEENEIWIANKHDAIKLDAIKLANKLNIDENLHDEIQSVVDQLLKLRFQDYEGIDLLPALSICVLSEKYDDIHTIADVDDVAALISEFDNTILQKYQKLALKRID